MATAILKATKHFFLAIVAIAVVLATLLILPVAIPTHNVAASVAHE